MDCRDLKQNIDAYWDRELAPDASARVQTHLQHCPACRAEYGALDHLLGSPEPVTVPAGLRDRVLEAVIRAREESSPLVAHAVPKRAVVQIEDSPRRTAAKREESEPVRHRRWMVPMAWVGALAACIAMLLLNHPGFQRTPIGVPLAVNHEGAPVNPLAVPGLLFAAIQPGHLPLAGAALFQAVALDQITRVGAESPQRVNRRPLREDYVPLQDDRGLPLPAVMSAVSRTLGA